MKKQRINLCKKFVHETTGLNKPCSKADKDGKCTLNECMYSSSVIKSLGYERVFKPCQVKE